jgi:3-oxoadipate enol-lactonase
MATATPPHHGFAEINGASLFYEMAGAGDPLVMLHGHLVDSGQWDEQFAALSAAHTVVRYDARGYGQSSQPTAEFSHPADLLALLAFLNLDRAALMGCSGGGAACVEFALLNPGRVTALILVGSGLGGYQLSGPPPPQVLAYSQALQRGDLEQAIELSLALFTDGPRRRPEQVNQQAREHTRRMTAGMFARPLDGQRLATGLTPPAIERLGEIHAPTLVITGAEDNPIIHDIAALLLARIPGAKSVTIPDAGHHPNLEHPALFNQIVEQFLA